MRYGEVGGRIWREGCSCECTRSCVVHQGFLICSSVVFLTGVSCAIAGAARAAGTASCCGFFFHAQKPSASDHEVEVGFASSLAGDGVAVGGGVTVVAVGAMAAGFSLFAAAAAATSLQIGLSEGRPWRHAQ